MKAQLLGPPAISEADIYINQSYNFEIYDGDLNQVSFLNNVVDFRRVVLHELGHVIGLDHVTGATSDNAAFYGRPRSLAKR